MSIGKALDIVERAGVHGWARAETALRFAADREAKSPMAAAIIARDKMRLVETIVRQCGYALPLWALLPGFDQMRHRQPYDETRVQEARAVMAALERLVSNAPDRSLGEVLRQILILAHSASDALGDSATASEHSKGPFLLPPGPFEALREAIAPLLGASSLLGALAALDRLVSDRALTVGSERVAAVFAWPIFLQRAVKLDVFRPPPPLPNSLPTLFTQIEADAENRRVLIGRVERWYDEALQKAAYQRTGAYVPKALQWICGHPVFTAQTLAEKIGVVERTGQILAKRLDNAGVIIPFQKSGKLTLWTLKNDPYQEHQFI
ncbi:MAG: hypothetical protein AAF562_05540 [Pseudomonadota bacterium]